MAYGDYKQNRQDAQDEVLSYWNVVPTERDNMVKVLEDNQAVFAASIHRIAYNTGHTFKEVTDLVTLFARQGMSFHKVLRLTEDALNCIGPTPTVADVSQMKRDVEAFNALKDAAARNNKEEASYVWQYGQLAAIERKGPSLTFEQLRQIFHC